MIYAWLGAALVGMSLGLLGSGGSILTVPVLVYLVGEPEKLAIAESLAIVGGISVVGALPFALRRQIHWRSVLWFGLPGVAGTYAGATLSQFMSGAVQLLLFALIMLVAAVMMWREREKETTQTHPAWQIVLEGLTVGIITGLVGVGGGFLIIPALVLLGGLSMQLAVGTSLLIIALKSFAGFFKYLDILGDYGVSWGLVGLFIGLGILGSFAGSALSQRLSQALLSRVFAGVLVLMGIYILYTSLPDAVGMQPSLWLVTAFVLLLTAITLWLSGKRRSKRVSEISS